MHRSADGGVSWKHSDSGFPHNFRLSTLAVDPKAPATLYAGTQGDGVFKSSDSGATWAFTGDDKLGKENVHALAVDPVGNETVWAGVAVRSIGATTTGKSWAKKSTDQWRPFDGDAFAIDPTNPKIVYVAVPNRVIKTTDLGRSWTEIAKGFNWINFSALALDPSGTLYAGTNREGVLKTTDGGRNWTPTPDGFQATDIEALVADPSAPGTIYVGTVQGNVSKTVDGGKTWTRLSEGMTTTDVRGVAIDPTSPKILFAGTDEGIFRSVDGGEEWTQVHRDIAVQRSIGSFIFDPNDPKRIWSRDADTIYASEDGGKSWKESEVPDRGSSLVGLFGFAATPEGLFLSTHAGLFRSTRRRKDLEQERRRHPPLPDPDDRLRQGEQDDLRRHRGRGRLQERRRRRDMDRRPPGSRPDERAGSHDRPGRQPDPVRGHVEEGHVPLPGRRHVLGAVRGRGSASRPHRPRAGLPEPRPDPRRHPGRGVWSLDTKAAGAAPPPPSTPKKAAPGGYPALQKRRSRNLFRGPRLPLRRRSHALESVAARAPAHRPYRVPRRGKRTIHIHTHTRSPTQAKPEPAQPKVKEKRKIVVISPEKEIVVDDDGVFMSGEGWDDPEMFADLGEMGELPEFSWFEGGGYIGIRPLEMTPELRTHFGAPKEAGVFVGTVEKDSPAAEAGLQVGDIVTSADGGRSRAQEGSRAHDPAQERGRDGPDELVRDRAATTLTVTVAERADSRVRVGDSGPGMRQFHMRHPRAWGQSRRSRRFLPRLRPRRGSAGVPAAAGRSRAAARRTREPRSPETELASGSRLFKTFLRAAGDPAARFLSGLSPGPAPPGANGYGDGHEHARRDAARVLPRPGLHRAGNCDLQDPARAEAPRHLVP